MMYENGFKVFFKNIVFNSLNMLTLFLEMEQQPFSRGLTSTAGVNLYRLTKTRF